MSSNDDGASRLTTIIDLSGNSLTKYGALIWGTPSSGVVRGGNG
jgi:hypothetical protein